MLDDSQKPRARELLLQSKTYRMFATIFAVAGLVVFFTLYVIFYDGKVMVALRDPLIILYLLCPFIPAIVFSRRAKKAETELQKLLSGPQ
jgi:hypothetical protein